jgi:hypothetical protein
VDGTKPLSWKTSGLSGQIPFFSKPFMAVPTLVNLPYASPSSWLIWNCEMVPPGWVHSHLSQAWLK